MGSYSQPDLRERKSFGTFDFGGGATVTYKVAVPAASGRAFLHEIGVENITEAFADDTITAKVNVGRTGAATAYGSLVIPDGTATTAIYNGSHGFLGDDTDAVTQPEIDLDDLTDRILLVTLVNGTDTGTVAGIGVPYIIISYW